MGRNFFLNKYITSVCIIKCHSLYINISQEKELRYSPQIKKRKKIKRGFNFMKSFKELFKTESLLEFFLKINAHHVGLMRFSPRYIIYSDNSVSLNIVNMFIDKDIVFFKHIKKCYDYFLINKFKNKIDLKNARTYYIYIYMYLDKVLNNCCIRVNVYIFLIIISII